MPIVLDLTLPTLHNTAQTTDPVPIYYTCIFHLDPGPTGGLPVSRSGPQRNKQRFPDEDRISTGHSVQH